MSAIEGPIVQIRRGSRIDPPVQARAFDLTLQEFGPSAIERTLNQEFGRARSPSLRWIKALRASLRREPSEPWDFEDADPDEAAAVLPVLARVIEQTLGKVTSLTKGEAAVIWRIRRATPDSDEWDAYRLARQFAAATPGESDPLVWYLAFAPWRDGGQRIRRAYANGWIDRLAYRYETPAEAAGEEPAREGTTE